MVAASTAIRPDLVRVILRMQELQQEVWQHLWVMVNRNDGCQMVFGWVNYAVFNIQPPIWHLH